jgi:hypothetical protein
MLCPRAGKAMPDTTGLLSPSENETIQRWWTQHWKAPVTCPVCKTSEWTIAPHVVNIQRYALDTGAQGTVTYPHIVVTCKSCAHSMFFNAAQIGVGTMHVPAPQNALGLASALGAGNPFGSFGAPPNPFAQSSPLEDLLKKK